MSNSAPQEGRGLKRHAIETVVDVYDANQGLRLGRLANIHVEGLMVMGSAGMQADYVYQLELRLPNPINGTDSIQLGADCLWVRNSEDSALCWAGCQIIDLSAAARQQIEILVQQMGD
ncbi:MAG: PilZ domain-containing protein [Gammaproteobacteria bacterium]|uniref:PilZ domain-containing protein n=1 Tax=Pseudomaricurvus alcaniphilus TaxID=1166482 RepID=UPI00140C2A65|nr:PilZ domain-containing protein [Pseudomaricurvus alcaniphilus]MBR9912722.1 PilZ domain-containing protein [Gammaproteobacteria bacterium]NHN38900.1 PilZ domain-containing protein [Pseudomaricurvus alcaniphilus]